MGHLKPDSTNDKEAGKEVVSVRTFNDILNLAYFEFLAESVLQMAKYDEKKGIFGVLSMPYQLLPAIKSTTSLLWARC